MSILKTQTYYEDWIASHYELHAANGNFYFGQDDLYPQDYYDAVLSRRAIPFFKTNSNSIINLLKRELTQGYYILMYIKTYSDKEVYHDELIYGFDDDKQIIYCLGPENHSFRTTSYTYNYIEDNLEDVKKFIYNQKIGMILALTYNNTFSLTRCKEIYQTGNCVFEAYQKIKNELYGGDSVRNRVMYRGFYEETIHIYKGLSCLKAMDDILKRILLGEELPQHSRGIAIGFQKLYEHRKMMLISMQYVIKNWTNAIDTKAEECLMMYDENLKTVFKWKNMAIKFEMTQNLDIIKRILVDIPTLYDKEYQCLNRFINHYIDLDKVYEYYL